MLEWPAMRILAILLFTMIAACTTVQSAVIAVEDSGVASTGVEADALGLCINEFMPKSDDGWQDETGASPDWIELHNPSPQAVSLAGWHLTDDPDSPFGVPIDPTLSIDAAGFLLFSADNLPDLGPTHLPFALSGTGDSLGLFRYDGAGEVLHFGTAEDDHAWARQSDCCVELPNCMKQVWLGSPGEANDT
jgi:hypothetical protein